MCAKLLYNYSQMHASVSNKWYSSLKIKVFSTPLLLYQKAQFGSLYIVGVLDAANPLFYEINQRIFHKQMSLSHLSNTFYEYLTSKVPLKITLLHIMFNSSRNADG